MVEVVAVLEGGLLLAGTEADVTEIEEEDEDDVDEEVLVVLGGGGSREGTSDLGTARLASTCTHTRTHTHIHISVNT